MADWKIDLKCKTLKTVVLKIALIDTICKSVGFSFSFLVLS
jgi:hypothetical protein